MMLKTSLGPLSNISIVSLLACSRVQPTQKPSPSMPDIGVLALSGSGEKHRVSPDQPVQIGSGYNTVTDSIAGDCMERTSLTTLSDDFRDRTLSSSSSNRPGTAGNEVLVTYVEDHKRLSQELGTRASARARFFLFSVSAEAEYANSSDFSSNSSFMLASATMRKETERLERYTIEKSALSLLKTNPRAFFMRCGDQFVAGRIKGASFTAIVEIRDTTSETRSALREKLGAGLSLGTFGANFSVQRNTRLGQLLSRHELHYKVISSGLSANNPRTIDEFIEKALSLEETINRFSDGKEAAIEFVTRSYEIADNFPSEFHLPSLVAQNRFLDQMATYHQETAIIIKDLDRGSTYAPAKPCANSQARRQNIGANLIASNKRIEDRAHACARDPERMCNLDGLPLPSFEEAKAWLSECTNLEGALQAKADEALRSQRADLARIQFEEVSNRAAAESAQRNRGRPGGAPCDHWLLKRVVVEVPEVRPEGSSWDQNGDLPDLYVRVRIDGSSRETNYQVDATRALFNLEPPIPMKSGSKIQLDAWDFDKNGFWGIDRDFALSVATTVPRSIPQAGFQVGNARGSFDILGDCVDKTESTNQGPSVFR